jgi:hypothetical protein
VEIYQLIRRILIFVMNFVNSSNSHDYPDSLLLNNFTSSLLEDRDTIRCNHCIITKIEGSKGSE